MSRISSFYVVYVAFVILFLSQFCAFGHEHRSATIHRLKRSTMDESLQPQQQQHKKSASDPNHMDSIDEHLPKDRYKNDKIIFEQDDMYNSKTTERTLDAPLFSPSLLAIRSNPLKSTNETNHQYSGKANGEYEFR